jgi:3-dehydroquinate dehydratase/shikimate dehydrogenase
MLIAVVPVLDYAQAHADIAGIRGQVSGIELRLDYRATHVLDALANLRQAYPELAFIFTLRSVDQGGRYAFDDEQRQIDLLSLCQLQPDYLDLEYDLPLDFVRALHESYPHIRLICSFHDFNETPADLSACIAVLQQPYFSLYKIATFARTTSDALRMVDCIRTHPKKGTLIGICMGALGQCTRILSPVMGNVMHYASLDAANETAKGQLTVHELVTTYRIHTLNIASRIYALLGDPVDASLGHQLHNQAFALLGENAVYIKLHVTAAALPAVLKRCRQLPFDGFSITMPLKTVILPLLDEIDDAARPIGAINSIVRHGERYCGFNTDGLGAIEALLEHTPLAGKTVVILGAGGAARAIAHALVRVGANVIVLNRTVAHAVEIATAIGCIGLGLDAIGSLAAHGYAVIINTLPEHVYRELLPPIVAAQLPPHVIAMEIVYRPQETGFLRMVQASHHQCIPGSAMFINQAMAQLKRWFQLDTNKLTEIMSIS